MEKTRGQTGTKVKVLAADNELQPEMWHYLIVLSLFILVWFVSRNEQMLADILYTSLFYSYSL